MKTLLAVLLTMTFALSTQSFAQSQDDLKAKISDLLDDAESLPGAELAFKKIITVNALSSLANLKRA